MCIFVNFFGLFYFFLRKISNTKVFGNNILFSHTHSHIIILAPLPPGHVNDLFPLIADSVSTIPFLQQCIL